MSSTLVEIFTKDLLAKWGISGMIIVVLSLIVIWLLKRMMNDKSKTITELREENKHYREIFKTVVDERFIPVAPPQNP